MMRGVGEGLSELRVETYKVTYPFMSYYAVNIIRSFNLDMGWGRTTTWAYGLHLLDLKYIIISL